MFAIMNINKIEIKVFFKLIGNDLLNKYAAKNIGKEILIISDVCNVKNPKSSHLLAPLISFPVNAVKRSKNNDINKKAKALFL